MDYQPPCRGRDEWTRDTNKHTFKPQAERQEDAAATLRAQYICMTQCEMRDTCMKAALDTPPEDDWFVWGGYVAWERERIRNGGLEIPKVMKSVKINWDRVNLLLDSHCTVEELADYLDKNPSSLQSQLRSYLYLMRLEAGDPWLALPGDVSDDDSCETAEDVAAA